MLGHRIHGILLGGTENKALLALRANAHQCVSAADIKPWVSRIDARTLKCALDSLADRGLAEKVSSWADDGRRMSTYKISERGLRLVDPVSGPLARRRF